MLRLLQLADKCQQVDVALENTIGLRLMTRRIRRAIRLAESELIFRDVINLMNFKASACARSWR